MPKKKSEYAHGKHPNTLKNLRPITDADRANACREKGLETRRANAERRKAIREAAKAFKGLKDEEIPKGIDVIRVFMMEAMARDDADEVTRLAAILAPYETGRAPQKIEQTVKTTDMSDEELTALAKEFGINAEDLH